MRRSSRRPSLRDMSCRCPQTTARLPGEAALRAFNEKEAETPARNQALHVFTIPLVSAMHLTRTTLFRNIMVDTLWPNVRWLAATPALSKRASSEAASEYLNSMKRLSLDTLQTTCVHCPPQPELTSSNSSGVGNHISRSTAGEERQGPPPAMLPSARAQYLGSVVSLSAARPRLTLSKMRYADQCQRHCVESDDVGRLGSLNRKAVREASDARARPRSLPIPVEPLQKVKCPSPASGSVGCPNRNTSESESLAF